MPLDKTRCRNAIIARLNSSFTVESGQNDVAADDRQTAIDIIVEEIFDEIENNALVTGTCPPSGGPLTGGSIT
ncbi:MAG: hypothetical protein OXO51_04830 [Gemmatimonadota bacterium]|nr:hypothetical protein [Gemmatimonadota bacterium]